MTRRKGEEQTSRHSERRLVRSLNQSHRLQEELRHLSRRVLLMQEEERKRISAELHDVVAQVLTSINLRLAILKAEVNIDPKKFKRSIANAQRLVRESVDIVHGFAYDLYPAMLDCLGLIPALNSFADSLMKTNGVRVSLTASAGVDNLDCAMRTVLYRVAREALTNVVLHARAGRVEVNIRRLPNSVRMDVSDNGKGFSPKRVSYDGKRNGRLGLLEVKERVEMVGGKFRIESAPGRGTIIHAEIPASNGTEDCNR